MIAFALMNDIKLLNLTTLPYVNRPSHKARQKLEKLIQSSCNRRPFELPV